MMVIIFWMESFEREYGREKNCATIDFLLRELGVVCK